MATNRKIKDYPNSLFGEGSPVVVDKMQLCYSTDYGVNMLMISFRNISPITMYGLSIVVEPKDRNGEPTKEGSIEYNYYGIEVPFNRAFGGTEGIVMEQEAAKFTVRVIRAEFADGAMFHGDITLAEMPKPQPIEALGKYEEQFKAQFAMKKPKLSPRFVPEKFSAYWTCSCGRVYPIDVNQCKVCYIDRDWITGLYPGILAEEERRKEELAEQAKMEAEEAERKRLEEEARIAEEERLKAEAERIARESEELARIQAEEAEKKAKFEAERKKRRLIKAGIIVGVSILVLVGAYFGVNAIIKETRAKMAAEAELESIRQAEAEAATATTAAPETEATTVFDPERSTGEGYIPGRDDEINITGTAMAYISFRKGPGDEYELIDMIYPEETFKIIGQDGQWFHIEREGEDGYVYFAYVLVQ